MVDGENKLQNCIRLLDPKKQADITWFLALLDDEKQRLSGAFGGIYQLPFPQDLREMRRGACLYGNGERQRALL